VKLFLVDDHPIVRAGLAALFEGEAGVEIVGEAADGTDAVRLIGLRSPDVVLMDLRLEGDLDGVAVTERVLALPAPPRVLVLTTYENDGDIMRALDALHPAYGFARHKGYGTRAHLEALARLGPCAAHRRSFAPVRAAATAQEEASR
jgi:DNA-binding NarL/FixJ family response regulator